MWQEGIIETEKASFRYTMKVYEQPSIYGIHGGRISKLWLADAKGPEASYDRGWDMQPRTAAGREAVKKLVLEYN